MRIAPKIFKEHSWVRPTLAILLALSAGAIVETRSRTAAALRDRWSPGGEVLLAAGPLEPGVSLTEADIIRTPAPELLRPTAPLLNLAGATIVRSIGAGEILTLADVSPSGAGPTGEAQWIAIPVDNDATPRLLTQDRVDLFGGDPFGGPAELIAQGAVVVSIDEDRLTVEVDSATSARLATQIVAGMVIVVLVER